MLSPGSATSPVVLGIVFVLLLAGLAVNALIKDRKAYQRFSQLTSSSARRRTLGRWLLQAFVLFGGCSLITLALGWRYVPLVLGAVDGIDWVADARAGFLSSGFGPGIAVGAVVALAVGAVVGILAARKSLTGESAVREPNNTEPNSSEPVRSNSVGTAAGTAESGIAEPGTADPVAAEPGIADPVAAEPGTTDASIPSIPTIGDVQALLPRNRAELPYGAALSINAGIVEELLFRLAMPALIFAFTNNVVISVVGSVVVFGALHAYQGIAGVVGATVIGAVLMAVYLGTESIVVAIVVHALFDLRSLVLIPVLVTRAHRIPATD
jgi:uncharacterized protein